jgi:hypothetical protein
MLSVTFHLLLTQVYFCDIVYYIYLIIYGLFNNHVSSSAYVVDNELEGTGKETYED